LENAIERAVVLCEHGIIKPYHLPEALQKKNPYFDLKDLSSDIKLPQVLENIEAELIRQALVKTNYVQAKAARLLGITKSLLQYKIKKYNLSP